jgi:hypothetical protein
MSIRRDLTDQKFGALTAKTYAGTINGKSYWKCECLCGKETTVQTGNLLRGGTKSCGCGLHKEKRPPQQCSKCHTLKPLKKFQLIKRRNRAPYYEAKCRDCINEETRKRYENDPTPINTRNRKYRQSHREELNLQVKNIHRTIRWALKLEVIAFYGGQCACCGESNIYFLQIDHLHGGGRKHRSRIKTTAGIHFYVWLRNEGFPPGYRVLCANCNSAFGAYGFCPHEGRGKQLQLL